MILRNHHNDIGRSPEPPQEQAEPEQTWQQFADENPDDADECDRAFIEAGNLTAIMEALERDQYLGPALTEHRRRWLNGEEPLSLLQQRAAAARARVNAMRLSVEAAIRRPDVPAAGLPHGFVDMDPDGQS